MQAAGQAIAEGLLNRTDLDRAVYRNLLYMFASRSYDRPNVDVNATRAALLDGPEKRQLATEAALQGMVLVKNEKNLLPLNADAARSGKLKLAVVGPLGETWDGPGEGGEGMGDGACEERGEGGVSHTCTHPMPSITRRRAAPRRTLTPSPHPARRLLPHPARRL